MRELTKITALILCLTLVLTVGSFAVAEGENVLKVHIETEVESLDPQVATDGTSFEVIANFTDGLYQIAADGSAIPALAAETVVSEDGLTYTFTIRDDANWSNGDPVTADDFVFAWQRATDPDFASEYSYMMTDIGLIKNASAINAGEMAVEELGVTAIDEKTLQVELESPVSFFTSLMYFPTFYPVNRAFCESCGDSFATSPETVLSCGAFVLTSYEPAATSFSLAKNPDYYDADRVQAGRPDLSGDQGQPDLPCSATRTATWTWLPCPATRWNWWKTIRNSRSSTPAICGTSPLTPRTWRNWPTSTSARRWPARMTALPSVPPSSRTAPAPAYFAVPEQLATGPDGLDFRATAP